MPENQSDAEREARFQKAIRDLQDALIVTDAIQSCHGQMLKDHQQFLAAHEEAMLAHARSLRETDTEVEILRREAERWRIKTERNLSEITDKLNGLIGYLDGQHKPPQ